MAVFNIWNFHLTVSCKSQRMRLMSAGASRHRNLQTRHARRQVLHDSRRVDAVGGTRSIHGRHDVADGRHRVGGVAAPSHARPPLAQRRHQRPACEDPRKGACAEPDPARARGSRASTARARQAPRHTERWRALRLRQVQQSAHRRQVGWVSGVSVDGAALRQFRKVELVVEEEARVSRLFHHVDTVPS